MRLRSTTPGIGAARVAGQAEAAAGTASAPHAGCLPYCPLAWLGLLFARYVTSTLQHRHVHIPSARAQQIYSGSPSHRCPRLGVCIAHPAPDRVSHCALTVSLTLSLPPSLIIKITPAATARNRCPSLRGRIISAIHHVTRMPFPSLYSCYLVSCWHVTLRMVRVVGCAVRAPLRARPAAAG